MEQLEVTMSTDTIAAVSTPSGTGGIAIIRVSGPQAISIVNKAWKGADLASVGSHTAHLGKYVDTNDNVLDEAVATLFKGPNSFTGDDTVEISVHGSRWIQRQVLNDLIARGARIADAGEFTRRAFMNGRIDLAQAEGIADLIAASSRAAHDIAISQTKGIFSKKLDQLRDRLVEFASMLELELDFSEEDVEFADRSHLLDLSNSILKFIGRLANSYAAGSAIKEGVPVVIAGVPNAGKSTLLNLLLDDDKAIVSDIPGTTRDIIEDTAEINGLLFRFIDTAGLRDTSDRIEALGIEKAMQKVQVASVVIWILDPTSPLSAQMDALCKMRMMHPGKKFITLIGKSDLFNTAQTVDESDIVDCEETNSLISDSNVEDILNKLKSATTTDSSSKTDPIIFSAHTGYGLDKLKQALHDTVFGDTDPEEQLIVTNARHFESLQRGSESLRRAIEGIENGISAEFIAQDIRETIHHLSLITGAITTDTLLHSIFSRFCIGK